MRKALKWICLPLFVAAVMLITEVLCQLPVLRQSQASGDTSLALSEIVCTNPVAEE